MVVCRFPSARALPALPLGAPTEATGALRGVVLDDATGKYVAGAVPTVVGTARSAGTDSQGRFQIGPLPPGEYRRNRAEQLWAKLFSRHVNVAFVLSGDLRRTARGAGSPPVHSLMSDHTSSGPLRPYRFVPRENRAPVIAFDTTTCQLVASMMCVAARDEHRFSFPYPMSSPSQ